MPWIKLDTDFYRHPKTAELLAQRGGAEAVIALQQMWCWAGGSDSPQGRDGYVSDSVARMLGVTKRHAQLLEDAGYVHRNGAGWHLHDWNDHQGALLDKRVRDRENVARRRRAQATDE